MFRAANVTIVKIFVKARLGYCDLYELLEIRVCVCYWKRLDEFSSPGLILLPFNPPESYFGRERAEFERETHCRTIV